MLHIWKGLNSKLKQMFLPSEKLKRKRLFAKDRCYHRNEIFDFKNEEFLPFENEMNNHPPPPPPAASLLEKITLEGIEKCLSNTAISTSSTATPSPSTATPSPSTTTPSPSTATPSPSSESSWEALPSPPTNELIRLNEQHHPPPGGEEEDTISRETTSGSNSPLSIFPDFEEDNKSCGISSLHICCVFHSVRRGMLENLCSVIHGVL